MRGIIEVSGLSVFYTRECECENPKKTLLFLHGWGGSSNSWAENIRELKKSFDCIAVDMPGFSVSQTPSQVWGIQEYAKFVRDLVEALRIEKVVIVAKSFGGRVAMYYAVRWPETLSHLVLVAAAGVEGKSLLTRTKILAAKAGKTVLSLFGKKPASLFRGWYYRAVGIKPDSGDYKWQVKKLVTSVDLSSVAKATDVPTLIVWGKDDKVLSLRVGKKLSRLIKNSKFEVITGGHDAHRESAREFNSILLDFLGN